MYTYIPPPADSSTDPKYRYITEFKKKAEDFYKEYLKKEGHEYLAKISNKFNQLAIEAMVEFAIQEKNKAVEAHTQEVLDKLSNQTYWSGTDFNFERISQLLLDKNV